MTSYFLTDKELAEFLEQLLKKHPVIAPVAKRSRFVFSELEDVDELRLDYDTTILPPKKVFFPPEQRLVNFTSEGFESCLEPKEQVLFGVHPHDIKAISMADRFYAENNADGDYLANRKMTTIVGSNVQNHYKRAFFGTVCQEVPVTGHDAFLTRIEGGYVFETLTDRGEALIGEQSWTTATDAQIDQARGVVEEANNNCPEQLNNTAEDIRVKVRSHFEDAELWNDFSHDCFSCGSCNTVCPTCFCFDVQDNWNIDGASGSRTRAWDACMVCEFAEVSVQGSCENFRDTPSTRFPHRIMRKAAYMNDLFGGPACVGCGRCSGACTADIADPTTIINTIMERSS